MQNVGQNDATNSQQDVKTVEVGQASLTPLPSSPVMEKAQVLAAIQHNFMDLSPSEEDEASEVESFILDQEDGEEGETILDTSKFLLSPENMDGADLRSVDPETQDRLEALLEAAGIGKLSTADGKAFADPEVLRRLTSSVSCALDEAAQALTRMRAEQQGQLMQGDRSLAEACSDGDIGTVRKLLDEGRSVHETTEEGESLLSLACSAGYYELAQVLLAMRANVEDRGIKGDCTPLMEAASGGHVEIVRLLIAHGADVNAQSSAGNTPLHYAACGGFEEVVSVLIEAKANVEEHNENGHTPLMEAASAGHVGVAKILLKAGAGINAHSNEFKESALTLACYKGHLEMVKFLLEAGADQEHKTDEMHTALMEASMDGHVEVARLLLDSGAQVNMPADSFESPLTLAACGGHVELANLLIERGANLEEVNDEGYTPLMEAAREGHEEMVALLLAHGADINVQTEETQETALTLACCGGFLEVSDFLIKAGADIELGCSTPLMEAAQEGHLELVKYLLKAGANVNAQTGTGDTALTYACENGHTDVAAVLLEHGAELEHESEGGRTPLMKAARAGHLCTVQFLITKGADVNRCTSTNDHTVLSLACAGGHLTVVQLLLDHGGDSNHKLKDGSTMLIEAAKGGHTPVVNLLLDWPTAALSPTADLSQLTPPEQCNITELPRVPMHGLDNVVPPQDPNQVPLTPGYAPNQQTVVAPVPGQVNPKELNIPTRNVEQIRQNMQKSMSGNRKSKDHPDVTKKNNANTQQQPQVLHQQPQLQPQQLQQQPQQQPQQPQPQIQPQQKQPLQSQPLQPQPLQPQQQLQQQPATQQQVTDVDTYLVYEKNLSGKESMGSSTSSLDLDNNKLDSKTSEKCEKLEAIINNMMRKAEMFNTREEQILKKQQILEELQKVERELQEKAHAQLVLNTVPMPQGQQPTVLGAQFLPPPMSPIKQAPPSPGGMTLRTSVADTPKVNNMEMKQNNVHVGVVGNQELGLPNGPTDGLEAVLPPPPPPSAGNSPSSQTFTNNNNISNQEITPPHLREKKKAKRTLNKQQPQTTPTPLISSVDPPICNTPSEANKLSKPSHSNQQPQQQQPVNVPNLGPGGEGEKSVPETKKDAKKPKEGVDSTAVSQNGVDLTPEGSPSKDEKAGSRASSEEVDLSNVVPATEFKQELQQRKQLLQQKQQQMQNQQAQVHKEKDGEPGSLLRDDPHKPDSPASPPPPHGTKQKASEDGQQSEKRLKGSPDGEAVEVLLTQGQGMPLQTVLEQSVAAATSTAAALLDQQYQQLQQERQQLQANFALQQQCVLEVQVQQELQQQLKLQQEYQQLQQQLKAQQALTQQLDLHAPHLNDPSQPPHNHDELQQQLLQQQQQQFALQQLHAQQKIQQQQQAANMQAPTQQQQLKLQHDLQHQLKLQQVQQQLQQQLQQVQQLQASQQLTQQELLQQAQQLQQQLQQAQQLQQLSTHQPAQPLTQQDLLQQAQQLQQHLQQAQQLQQLAQHQKQLTHLQTAQPKKVKKKHTLLQQPQQPLGVPAPQPGVAQPAAPPVPQPLNYVPATNLQTLDTVTPPSSQPLTPNPSPASPQITPAVYPSMDLDAQTESNHDTALTLACAGGHAELVTLLLTRGADIEHRDKKGFTPLILSATAGHADVVEILLDHGADIEAQSERTKDTPLSLACSGGRYEVVEALLTRGANKEHRNVSDYTPLSLAASGGYVNIIKLLLSHGAEINSRTGSKLGISPLMLAAMNGHTAAVKLLLDMGSDINAQIETNRNTALTLACFQGRHEVVSLLVDRKANIEHRAKTGLTPLMEAASGGYVEVGRVLLDKGADVNAPPVPSSRDTALTIAADKGHYRFVDLLLSRGAAVDVKNKKGNSPLWLACNGGHLDVVQLLVNNSADVDSQDNRKVSCLMASFRKGHIKVVKYLVKHVSQFPSDQECMRYIATIGDKELLKKCHQCMEIIVSAKDRQAAEANKNASILLEELDAEKSREESKRAALARKRQRRRLKKKEKQEQKKEEREKEGKEDSKNSSPEPEDKDDGDNDEDEQDGDSVPEPEVTTSTPTPTTTDHAVSSAAMRVAPVITSTAPPRAPVPPMVIKHTPAAPPPVSTKAESRATSSTSVSSSSSTASSSSGPTASKRNKNEANVATAEGSSSLSNSRGKRMKKRGDRAERAEHHRKSSATTTASNVEPTVQMPTIPNTTPSITTATTTISHSTYGVTRRANKAEIHHVSVTSSTGIGDLDDFGLPTTNLRSIASPKEKDKNHKNITDKSSSKVSSLDTFSVPSLSPVKVNGSDRSHKSSTLTSPKRGTKKEEGWKEVVRKSKKVSVPAAAISRVIGRAGCNINAIREVSGAHIELDKQKGAGERTITIKGSAEATRQAHNLITALVKDPDKELEALLPSKNKQKMASATITTTTHTMSSNMWHNSMANNIPALTAVSSTPTPSPSLQVTLAAMIQPKIRNKFTNTTQPVAAGPPQVLAPFANIVKQTQPGGTVGPPRVPQLGAPIMPLGTPPQSVSPLPVSGAGTPSANIMSSGGVTPSKTPAEVAKRLFPVDTDKNAPNPVTTMAKNTITYSKPSMAKTKVVVATTSTMSQPVFANSQVETIMTDSGGRPVPGGHQVQGRVGKLGGDLHNASQVELQQSLGTRIHNSQPIMSSSIQPHISTSMPVTAPSSISAHPPEYSPFNNLFNQVAEILGSKREESHQEPNRPNFAAVAAIGVSQAPSLPLTSASPGPPRNQPQDDIDPSLPSKAPGYKAPGSQRTASPHIQDMSKAPGFKGNFSHPPPPLNQHIDHMDLMRGITIATQGGPMTGDPSKAPGYKGTPMSMAHFMEQLERDKYMSMVSQANLSPRSVGSTPGTSGGQSPRPFDLGHHARDEYSTPNQPMTLPKIESTLNPNAPDFTSRTAVAFLHHQLMSLQQQAGMSQGFNPMAPPLNQAPNNVPPVRVPPPGPMGQPPFTNNPMMGAPGSGFVMPPNVNIPELMGNFLNSAMMAGSASGNMGGMGMPAQPVGPAMQHPVPPVRPYMQQGPAAPGSASQSMGSSSQGGSPAPVSSEASPSSSSAPSPTDHQMAAGAMEDRRLPRPIGTERAHKKPVPGGGGYASGGQGGMAEQQGGSSGLWAYQPDIGRDWMRDSSVMTTTVVTSTVMAPGVIVPGVGADGEDVRPASHPAMSSHLLTGPPNFTDPAVIDVLEHNFQSSAALLMSNVGTPVFANGLPPSGMPQMPQLYSAQNVSRSADWTPSPSKMAGQVDASSNDPKVSWSNWNAPSNM